MWMNEVADSGHFVRAALLAMMKRAGAKEVTVEVVPDKVPPAGTFHIRWTE